MEWAKGQVCTVLFHLATSSGPFEAMDEVSNRQVTPLGAYQSQDRSKTTPNLQVS